MIKTYAGAVSQLRYHWLCRNIVDAHQAWRRSCLRDAVAWLRQNRDTLSESDKAARWFKQAGDYFRRQGK